MVNSQRVHGPWSVGRIYQTISRNHGYVSKNGTLMLDWFLEIKHAGPYVYIYVYSNIIYICKYYIHIYTHLFLLESQMFFCFSQKRFKPSVACFFGFPNSWTVYFELVGFFTGCETKSWHLEMDQYPLVMKRGWKIPELHIYTLW